MLVLVDKLNTSQHCALAAKAANSIPGCIRQRAGCQQGEGGDPSPLLSTGEALLEGWVHCWAPHYKRDMDMSEQVQRAKMIKGLERLPYEGRLRALGLFSLAQRRLGGLLLKCINT